LGPARLIGISPEGVVHWSYPIKECSGWLGAHNRSSVQLWALGHFSDPYRLDIAYTWSRASLYTSNETAVVTGWGRDRLWRRDMVDIQCNIPGKQTEFLVFGGGMMATGDLAGDGSDSLVTPWPSYSVVRGKDGRQLYGRWFGFMNCRHALLYDLNGDGRLETFLASTWKTLAAQHKPNGQIAELWALAEGDGAPGPAAIGDPRGDGKIAIGLLGFKDGFRCLEGATGKVLWTIPRQEKVDPSNCVACDINGDGRQEFLYGDGKHLLAVGPGDKGQGAVVWQIALPDRIGNIAVGDVRGDGKAQVLCGCDDGGIYCVSE
jgi:hypothetical protein